MEAISRHHDLMSIYLQYASLDIEKNNVSSMLNVPMLKKYRTIFGGLDTPYVPTISRSSISKHTSLGPVLPGRLPLGKPLGRMLPSRLKMDNGDLPIMLRDVIIEEREETAVDAACSSLDAHKGKMRAGATSRSGCDDACVSTTFVAGTGDSYDFQSDLLNTPVASNMSYPMAEIPIAEETSSSFTRGPEYNFGPTNNLSGANYSLGDEQNNLQGNQTDGWTL